MSGSAGETILISRSPGRAVVISALGVTQIFAWGTSYYLPAVLAAPIVAETGWSLAWVVGGLSLGLLTAGVISPGSAAPSQRGGRPVLAVSAGSSHRPSRARAGAFASGVSMAWLMIGSAWGRVSRSCLCDPGRLFGESGRSAITTLTLFGGFASTVCWPLSAFLTRVWDGAAPASVYAGFQIAVALPIYRFLLPRELWRPASDRRGGFAGAPRPPPSPHASGSVSCSPRRLRWLRWSRR